MFRQRWLTGLGITLIFLPFVSVYIGEKYLNISALVSATANKIPKITSKLTNINQNLLLSYKQENLIAQIGSNIQRQYRTALVIGNSNYKLATELNNPINDANAIANSLKQLGFDVTLLKDADLRQMEQSIEDFNRKLRQGGTGLFYFAGHGTQVDGENYLIPIDARLEREQDVRYETLPLGKVLNIMEDAANDVNIIILDACRNNPFGRKWRSVQGGLAAPTQSVKGTLIAYATSPGKVALDGRGNNSPYTTALLRHIKTPNLDVEQMFKQVRAEVVKETKGKQTPWESSSLIGNFAFNIKADNNVATTVTQPLPISSPTPAVTPITKPIPTPSPVDAQKISYFTQPPRLVKTTTSYNRINEPAAVYYFTINLPDNSGEALQKITIQQKQGVDSIRFNLDKSFAYEGTYSQEGKKFALKDISSDQKTQTVTLTFNPPIAPGKNITVALKPIQNPQVSGVYLFGVTAFPPGEKSHGQFLGYGRLQIYPI